MSQQETSSTPPVRRIMVRAFVVGGALLVASCDMSPTSSYGFSLPEGDANLGEQHFVRLHCNDCHTVVGRDEFRASDRPYLMELPLGGETERIATYGELVTAIINPSHSISTRYEAADVSVNGESLMANYNYAMTVAELIDLVAFLQAQYQINIVNPTEYETYIYP